MKQQKKIAVASSSTELAISTQALALKGEINALHRETLKAGNEMMQNAVRCGQLLGQVKLILKASKTATFENWVEQNLDVSYRSVRSYMLLSNRLEELQNWQSSAILQTADSISEAFRLIETSRPAVSKTETTEPTIPTSAPPASPTEDVVSSPDYLDGDGEGGAGEPDLDLGKCPNCAGTKWTDDEDGPVCSKCHHPHGEPTGGADEDRIKTQRQKTVKTVEALQRAFDDLHLLLPRSEHKEAADTCKVLLRMARNWK